MNKLILGIGIGIGALGIGAYWYDKKKESSKKKYKLLVELGGSNINCLLIDFKANIMELPAKDLEDRIETIKTSDSSEVIGDLYGQLEKKYKAELKSLDLINISMFGPVCLNRKSKLYGTILNTPKKGWNKVSMPNTFSQYFNVPVANINVETDVNSAVLLEFYKGGHKKSSLAYITIGTGVGVGIISDGKIVHNLQHTEGGHICIKRYQNDTYIGNCPIHGDCLEGMITNKAIAERCNLDSKYSCESIDDSDPVWDIVAYYIAQLCLSLLYMVSLEKIIIGGGVINRESLLPKIRKAFLVMNNDYIVNESIQGDIDNYIVRTNFKNLAGILSANCIGGGNKDAKE